MSSFSTVLYTVQYSVHTVQDAELGHSSVTDSAVSQIIFFLNLIIVMGSMDSAVTQIIFFLNLIIVMGSTDSAVTQIIFF